MYRNAKQFYAVYVIGKDLFYVTFERQYIFFKVKKVGKFILKEQLYEFFAVSDTL